MQKEIIRENAHCVLKIIAHGAYPLFEHFDRLNFRLKLNVELLYCWFCIVTNY